MDAIAALFYIESPAETTQSDDRSYDDTTEATTESVLLSNAIQKGT